MDPQRQALSASELRDRLTQARDYYQNLDQSDPTYGYKKMIAESRISNLENAGCGDGSWGPGQRDYEEDLLRIQEEDGVTQGDLSDRFTDSDHSTPSTAPTHDRYGNALQTLNGGEFASDDLVYGSRKLFTAPSWDFASLDRGKGPPESSTNSSEDQRLTSTSESSPEFTTAATAKRRRQSSTLNQASPPGHLSKMMRPNLSLSPSIPSGATPSSAVSERSPVIPEGFFDLFGGDPNEASRELEKSKKEQERYEKMFKARKDQERKDEELARTLDAELNIPYTTTQMARPGPSNASATQSYLSPHGQYERPTPLSSSPVPSYTDPFASGPHGHKQGKALLPSSVQNPAQMKPVKSESADQLSGKENFARRNDDFIDLDSDDEEDFYSDYTLGYNHRDSVDMNRPVYGSNNGQYHPSGFMPGSFNPQSHNSTSAIGSWSNAANLARGLYNNAYNAVGQAFSGTSGIGRGGREPVNHGQRFGQPAEYIDLEDDNAMSQNMYERNLNRMGFDPYGGDVMDRYRERYDYIAHDPTRTAGEIKELLENIRPDEDLPPENREGTPAAMVYPLMEHQKLGLAWMRRMEEGSNKGGILADDMGLGKTIQALALMVSRKSTNPAKKTTLIVAPVALLKQWEREIQKKLKPGRQHQLSVYLCHGGASRKASFEKLRTFDVVLTTYGILATELKRREAIAVAKRQNPNWRPSGKNDTLSLLGDECQWYRVIIDEAQCIKNKNTRAALGASILQAETRFCMTGTPMMNNVTELYSLIHFLRIKPYCDIQKFRFDIERPLKTQSPTARDRAMTQLQAVLKSILLRRTKKSQIDGKPILQLPERTTEFQHAVFDEDEQSFYKALETQTQLQFNKYLKAGTVGKHYSNILVLLLRLRQACDHPHLIKDFAQGGGVADITSEEMIDLAKELAPDVINRIKDQAGQSESCGLECPVCMDLAPNATIFLPCGHDTCSECFARISDPSQAIAAGEAAEGRGDVKCPNCRGKIDPKRVIDFDSFRKVHMPETCDGHVQAQDSQEDVETTDDSSDDSTDGSDDEVDNKGNLRSFIVADDAEDDTTDDGEENDAPLKSKKPKKVKPSKGKGKSKEKAARKTLAQLKKEAGVGSKARQRYLRRLEKEWVPSAKIQKTMDILRDVASRQDPVTKQSEKTIIFSQFTSLLDLLEFPIHKEGFKYRRYDGSMSPKARNDAVLDFTDKPDIKVMLVSLKAGNAGLNLTMASQVIIFDPFWNPYIEEQAIDRAHRIGQMRPVHVHRILVPNTVEDRILALQDKKRELIESALDEKASQNIGRLGTRELAFLFDVQN